MENAGRHNQPSQVIIIEPEVHVVDDFRIIHKFIIIYYVVIWLGLGLGWRMMACSDGMMMIR